MAGRQPEAPRRTRACPAWAQATDIRTRSASRLPSESKELTDGERSLHQVTFPAAPRGGGEPGDLSDTRGRRHERGLRLGTRPVRHLSFLSTLETLKEQHPASCSENQGQTAKCPARSLGRGRAGD